jgi:hypothetical protein
MADVNDNGAPSNVALSPQAGRVAPGIFKRSYHQQRKAAEAVCFSARLARLEYFYV